MQVNSLLDNTDDQEDHLRHSADREITLGTTMILLIFFALAVYGAALFGFGYSLGSKHNSGLPEAAVTGAPSSLSSFGTFKPAAGSPLGGPATGPAASQAGMRDKPPAASEDTPVAYTPPAPVRTAPAPIERQTPPPAESDAFTAPRTPPAKPVATAGPVPSSGVGPAGLAAGNGTLVVQVAAVSHQEDADLIATTLQRRGYTVNVRTEPDKLLHVQVGPFTNRKDAEAMRARLLADGFNAYIK